MTMTQDGAARGRILPPSPTWWTPIPKINLGSLRERINQHRTTNHLTDTGPVFVPVDDEPDDELSQFLDAYIKGGSDPQPDSFGKMPPTVINIAESPDRIQPPDLMAPPGTIGSFGTTGTELVPVAPLLQPDSGKKGAFLRKIVTKLSKRNR